MKPKRLILLACAILIGLPLLWMGQQVYKMFFIPEKQPVPVDQGRLEIGSSTGVHTLSDIYQRDTYHFTVGHTIRVRIRLETTSDSQFSFAVVHDEQNYELGRSGTAIQGRPAALLIGVTASEYRIVVIPVSGGDYQLWLECGSEKGCS